jgi:hypothetical protein
MLAADLGAGKLTAAAIQPHERGQPDPEEDHGVPLTVFVGDGTRERALPSTAPGFVSETWKRRTERPSST